MPSHANPIEIVQAIYAAFGKGDVPGLLAHLADDVLWEPGYEHHRDIPWLRSGQGHAHVVQFLQSLQVFDVKRFEILSVMGKDSWVVALTSIEFVHKPSGRVLAEACEPHVWRFGEAGKVISMRHAADTRTHARVAGLER